MDIRIVIGLAMRQCNLKKLVHTVDMYKENFVYLNQLNILSLDVNLWPIKCVSITV